MRWWWKYRDNGEGIWLREQQEQRQRGVKLRGESEISAIKLQPRQGRGEEGMLAPYKAVAMEDQEEVK